MQLEHSVLLPHPPQAVYLALVDCANWPSWVTGLSEVVCERGDGSQRGDLFRQVIERGPLRVDLECEVTAAEPVQRAAHRSTNDQLEIETEHLLSPQGSGTRLVQRLELKLHSFALQMLGKKIRKELEQKQTADLAALAQLLRSAES